MALAKKLAEIRPSLGEVLFTTGGSDAVEVAIKLARAATGRCKRLLLGCVSRRGLRLGCGRRRSAVPLRPGRAADAGAEHVAPFSSYRCPYGTASSGGPPPPARA